MKLPSVWRWSPRSISLCLHSGSGEAASGQGASARLDELSLLLLQGNFYGLAARVPVILVTLAAIRGDWRTHYDQPPPGFPYIGNWLAKWLWIGLLPQMTIWMAYTVIVGSIAGGVALLFAGQRAAPRRPVVPVRRPPAVASPRPVLRPPPRRT